MRECEGLWDDGLGKGHVVKPVTGMLLVRFDSKERQSRSQVFKLESTCVARLVIPPTAGEDVTPALDLTVRFVEPVAAGLAEVSL